MPEHRSTTIDAAEAQSRFGELLAQVESGAEITIIRAGTPVARLSPLARSSDQTERRRAIERWAVAARGLSLGGLTIRELIDEGRR